MYLFPGSNFAPFEQVKVPVSNSAEVFQKGAPWRILVDLGWVGLRSVWPFFMHAQMYVHGFPFMIIYVLL